MIGVISRDGEKAIVKEFFQIFKTPSEFYNSNRTYDVVISTTQKNVAESKSKFIIIYSSGRLQTGIGTPDIRAYFRGSSVLEANGVE